MKSSFENLFLVVAIAGLVGGFPTEKLNFSFSNSLDVSNYVPDERAGKSLHIWEKSGNKGNPEEQGTYFEGDIMSNEARNAVDLESAKWEGGIIPYEVRGRFSQKDKNLLSDAIEEFKKHTCIKFIPRASEKDYIVFDNEKTGCWSHVGKIGGPQVVNYQTPGCMSLVGTVIHEILHALGFYHEQSRYDRDDYVKINFRNIARDKFVNFEKMPKDMMKTFNVTYDMSSVLHYSAFAFSLNNKMTIESRGDKTLNEVMGQREGFSSKDIEKVNAMYCQ